MSYPTGLTTLLRFDASQNAYSDLGQTTIAAAPLGKALSIPQPAPLSGSWVASGGGALPPTRTAVGTVAIEPLALDYPTHYCQLYNAPAPASPVQGNSCTIAISFRAFQLYNGPANALLTDGLLGHYFAGSGLALRYSGGIWDPGLTLGKDLNTAVVSGDTGVGNLVCVVARYSPTGLDLKIDEEGTVRTAALAATVTASTHTAFTLGQSGGGYGNIMVGQAAIIDTPVSDADRDALIAWLKATGVAPMFPTTQPLVAVIGDSIGVPFGPPSPQGWPCRMIANLRAGSVLPDAQLLNVSISGSGVTYTSGNFSAQFTTVANRLSSSRARQVVILQEASNTVVGDPSNSGVDAGLALQFALADALRAAGAKVIIATCLDRTGLLGGGTIAAMRAGIARYNAAIRSTGLAHCDAIADIAAIIALQDSTNTTYYSDGVHPTDVGHGLLEPVYTAAVLSVFAQSTPRHAVGSGSGCALRTASGSLVIY